jgi:exopolysaccharide production protein ExoZ
VVGHAGPTRPILSLQVLRALAALDVIYGHIGYDFTVKFGVVGFPPMLGMPIVGVDLFFVISGFIMVYASEPLFGRRDGPREFFKRRLIRIVPIYWATSLAALLYILVRQRASDLFPRAVFYKWAAASFLFLPYPRTNGEMSPLNGVGWTLNYEMFFYAVFAIAVFLPRRGAVASVSLLFAVMVAGGLLFGPLPNPAGFWCGPLILEFVAGMLIATAFREELLLPPWLAHGLVLLGLAGLLFGGRLIFGSVSDFLIRGAPSAMIVAGLALTEAPLGARDSGILARIFIFLGDASYSIYLVHPFALTAPRLLRFGLGGNGVTPPSQPWLYASIQFAAAVAAGVIVYLGFERPVTRVLRRLTGHRHKAGR